MTDVGSTPDAPVPPARPSLARDLSLVALVFLYLLGLAHWSFFFNALTWAKRPGGRELFGLAERTVAFTGGDIAFTNNEDWSKERDYYVILREALTTRQVPYAMNQEYQHTSLFLGLPETNLSPQILLLPYLSIPSFLWFNTLLLYTLGFAGCLLIRRRYRLGLAPFAALFLLFNFNGFITSHLAVGHSMWNGYFLLSFVVLYVLELVEEPASLVPALKLALVLFLMMLQGSFHIVIWVWMLLGLLLLFHPRYWKQVGLALVFSGWLSFFRIGPAAVALGGQGERGFWAGYPTLAEVLDGFIGLHDRDYPSANQGWTNSYINGHYLHWWEYDIYIGLLGLAVLVVFGIYLRFRDTPALEPCRYRELDAPLLMMAFLSLNYFWLFVANLPVPLLNAEGVSSRFLIVPVLMLLVISAIRMQRVLDGAQWNAALVVLLLGGLLQTAFSLAEHSYVWKIKPAAEEAEPTIRLISESSAPLYVASIWGSLLVSLVGVAAWVFVLLRAQRSVPAPAP